MAIAVLLVGITGSGKTTVARALEDRGLVRLSVDEEVHRLHGRYGVDYPEDEYFVRERPVVEDIRKRFTALLEAGRDVVLDHGLWLRGDRDAWKKLAESAGAVWQLIYLPVDRDELLRRLNERNKLQDANALTVTASALDDFFGRFEPPRPDEGAVVYAGDPAELA